MQLDVPHSEARFEQLVENPLTFVHNPRTTRLEALELERKLTQRSCSVQSRASLLTQAASLYEELGEYERALSNLRKAMSLHQEENAGLTNRMAQLVERVGDRRRAEKLYHEAARLDPRWSGPLFNLALLQRRHGEYADAIRSVEAAIDRQDLPPYHVLRATLAADTGDDPGRTSHLERASRSFGRLEDLDDWELYWKGKAAELSNDEEAKAAHVSEERRRRTRAGKKPDVGVLPGRKAGQVEAFGT